MEAKARNGSPLVSNVLPVKSNKIEQDSSRREIMIIVHVCTKVGKNRSNRPFEFRVYVCYRSVLSVGGERIDLRVAGISNGFLPRETPCE